MEKNEVAHEMGIALARTWLANMYARIGLDTTGSAMMENLPKRLERGGSAERASTSSCDH